MMLNKNTPVTSTDTRPSGGWAPLIPASASPTTSIPSQPGTVVFMSFLHHDPAVTLGRLPSGMKFVVYCHPKPRNRALFHLTVNAGSMHEDERQLGMAHMLEHCVFLGTKEFPSADAVRAEMTSMGVSAWGADSNAYTDYRETVYMLEAPSDRKGEGHRDALVKAMRLLKEIVLHPLLTGKGEQGDVGGVGSVSDGIETERAAVLSEAAMRNSIEWRLQQAAVALYHQETQLPHRFPIGMEEQIRSWTAADLRRFHSAWYRPENLTLFVVGDVEVKVALQALKGVFDPLASLDPLTKPEQPSWVYATADRDPYAPHPLPPVLFARSSILHDPGALCTRDRVGHRFGSTNRDAVGVFRSPLLTHCSITIMHKFPLEATNICTSERAQENLLDVVIDSVLLSRVQRIRRRSARPPFLSCNLFCGGIPSDDCSTCEMDVETDLGGEVPLVEAPLLPPSDDPVSMADVVELASKVPGGHVLHPKEPAVWADWQTSLASAVRECARLCRFRVPDHELTSAIRATSKSLADAAAQQQEDDAEDVMEEIQDAMAKGSVLLSPQQHLALSKAWFHEAALDRDAAAEQVWRRCNALFGYIVDVAEAARAFLTARGLYGATSASAEDLTELDDQEMLYEALGHLPYALSVFAAAPGDDTLGFGPSTGLTRASTSTELERTPSAMLGRPVHKATGNRAHLRDLVSKQPSVQAGGRAARPAWSRRMGSLQILRALASGLEGVAPLMDISTPTDLISPSLLDSLHEDFAEAARDAWKAAGASDEAIRAAKADQPQFVDMSTPGKCRLFGWPVEGMRPMLGEEVKPPPRSTTRLVNSTTGAAMRRLSNGVTLFFRPSKLQPRRCIIQVHIRGGYMCEGEHGYMVRPPDLLPVSAKPFRHGTTELAARVLIECGAGGFERDEINRRTRLWGLSLGHSSQSAEFSFTLSLDATSKAVADDGDLAAEIAAILERTASKADDDSADDDSADDDSADDDSADDEGDDSGDDVSADDDESVGNDSTSRAEDTSSPTAAEGESVMMRAFQVCAFRLTQLDAVSSTLERERQEAVTAAERSELEPSHMAWLNMMRTCAFEDERLLGALARESELVGMRDVAAAIGRCWDPRAVSIVVAGDFDLTDAEAAALRYLGPLTPSHFLRPALSILEAGRAAGDAECEAEPTDEGLPRRVNRFALVDGLELTPDGVAATRLAALPMDQTEAPRVRFRRDTSEVEGVRVLNCERLNAFLSCPVRLSGQSVVLPDPEPRAVVAMLIPSTGSLQDRLLRETQEAIHKGTVFPWAQFGEAFTTPEQAKPGLAVAALHPAPGQLSLLDHPIASLRIGLFAVDVLSNRMYRRVREELGLAYAADVSSSNTLSLAGDGSLEISVTPRPEHIAATVAAALHVITEFASGREPITEKEAEEVLKPEFPAIESSMHNDDHWLRSLGGLVEVGVPVLPACSADKRTFISLISARELDLELRRSLLAGCLTPPGEAWSARVEDPSKWSARVPLVVHTSIGVSGGAPVDWDDIVQGVSDWVVTHAAVDGVAGWIHGRRGSSLLALTAALVASSVWAALV
jgi:predicted Zn-dependent peptidase